MREPTPAPIALFVHRRPGHTRQVLESLRRNPEAATSRLYVYSDGPRNPAEVQAVQEVRSLCRDISGFASVVLVERERNLGLAESVIAGVSEVCSRHGRVIVLEDDLVVSPFFLSYMNEALTRYAEDARVMQVSGHQFPVPPPRDADAVFIPMTTSWGWATWDRAWRSFDRDMKGFTRLEQDRALRHRFDLEGAYPYFDMLRAQRRGDVDSWAIRWWLTVFMAGGWTLFPARTLVRNIGFDGSGRHCGEGTAMDGEMALSRPSLSPEVHLDPIVFLTIKQYFVSRHKTTFRIFNKLKSIFKKWIRRFF